jgi:hypothetical protein
MTLGGPNTDKENSVASIIIEEFLNLQNEELNSTFFISTSFLSPKVIKRKAALELFADAVSFVSTSKRLANVISLWVKLHERIFHLLRCTKIHHYVQYLL